ncbi:hypothetical protein XENORESO_010969 [Xenotaenia resolanae]|uniref:Uncharacterized protein n=1 Tax=Xenotaenia resolanae TaxID=208358 RepID=A0ABV0W8B8_9TELE
MKSTSAPVPLPAYIQYFPIVSVPILSVHCQVACCNSCHLACVFLLPLDFQCVSFIIKYLLYLTPNCLRLGILCNLMTNGSDQLNPAEITTLQVEWSLKLEQKCFYKNVKILPSLLLLGKQEWESLLWGSNLVFFMLWPPAISVLTPPHSPPPPQQLFLPQSMS